MTGPQAQNDLIGTGPRINIGDWLWGTSHAKIWWSAVPLYWGAMLASLWVDALAGFFSSAAAGFSNILFFPPVVALILSFGFLREVLQRASLAEAHNPGQEDLGSSLQYGPFGMLRELDPTDPASGPRWIGSTLNPTNAGYINRHPS